MKLSIYSISCDKPWWKKNRKIIYICITDSLCCTAVINTILSVQFSSLTQSCPTLRDPMNRSAPGLPVHHQLLEFTKTHVHRVSDAIQPSHPLSSPSPPAPNPSQHQSLFWVNSLHDNSTIFHEKEFLKTTLSYYYQKECLAWSNTCAGLRVSVAYEE